MRDQNRRLMIQHSNVPYVVKKEQHALERDNTIVVKNDRGVLNRLKKMFRNEK